MGDDHRIVERSGRAPLPVITCDIFSSECCCADCLVSVSSKACHIAGSSGGGYMKTGKRKELISRWFITLLFVWHSLTLSVQYWHIFSVYPDTLCIKSIKSVVLTEILVPPSQYCCLLNSVGISCAAHLVSPRPGHGGYWIQRKVAGWAVVRLVRCRHRRSVSK